MLDTMADKGNIRVRIVDFVSFVTWLTAAALLLRASTDGNDVEARWGLFLGMMALAVTFWAIATWVVDVIRLEFEITSLSSIKHVRRATGSGA